MAFIKGSPGTLLDMSCAHVSEAGVEPLPAADRDRYQGWNRELGSCRPARARAGLPRAAR